MKQREKENQLLHSQSRKSDNNTNQSNILNFGENDNWMLPKLNEQIRSTNILFAH